MSSAIAPSLPPARWWHPIEDKKVVCTLCPRECHIPPGSRGFCFVRANVEGHLELTTYGRSSGFCIDPVEKKPLNHFLPGTPILSLGTAGCNLGCKFCQNWDISKSREIDTLAHLATPQAIVEAALRTGCRSLAFTYNDPVIWAEYAIDIAKAAHAHGLKTVAVTAGYISEEARGEFYEHMDAANVDLKGFTEVFYRKLCQAQLEAILDTLKFLKRETNVWFELTNLMIPGENDSIDETRAMCGWIVENLGPDVPVHFTAFHPDFKMLDKPRTPAETLVRARQIALAAGIRYAYVGNVNDAANQSTYCHACGKLLIERDWYELGAYHLRGNACGFCGAVIPGVFDNAGPGQWGRRRQPITIADEPRLVKLTTSMNKNESTTGGNEAMPTSTATEPPTAETPTTETRTADAPTTGAAANEPAPAMMGAQPPTTPVAGSEPMPAPMATEPPIPIADVLASLAPKVDFTAEEDALILAYARAAMESGLRSQPISTAWLPDALAQAPTYGVFVSLHRGKQLRSCKGHAGHSQGGALAPLSQVLNMVARDAALNDPRFPRITLDELPCLSIEVSLMHSPQVVTATGEERANSVQVGTHGLVISHPNGRGLLLPQVATDAGWDARTFLEQICQKAGLPPHTWLDDRAALMTFGARKIDAAAQAPGLDPAEIGINGLGQLLGLIHQVLGGQNPQVPSQSQAPVLHRVHAEELGLCLQSPSQVTTATIARNNSLLSLAGAAAQSLANALAQRGLREPVQKMTVLWQPLALAAADYPHRLRMLANCAVLAQAGGQWSLVVAQPENQTDPIAQALGALKITHAQWLADRTGQIRLTMFNAVHCHCQPGAPPAEAAPAAVPVRAAFRAGMFYPADAAQSATEVDGYLHAGGLGQTPTQAYRAIMLPHAGWRMCGSTMGKTLAGAKIPRTVIIIGPKHTPLGPACSVASHTAWQIPGATIPVETSLAQRLSRAIPALQCEQEAHRQEHGTEVLLPFLLRLRPDLRIVPIVLGQCPAETIAALAHELAAILRDAKATAGEAPLLLISSDMNHFAPEAENRRRDMLALEAMQSGDPRRLQETCVQNDISMCGLLPAVTIMQALQEETPAIQPRLVDYTNSAAAAGGDITRVVGYAGVVIG